MTVMSSLAEESLFTADDLPPASSYLIAYSGGADSTALLFRCHQLSALSGKLRAIHINHGLQKPASQWQQHCQDRCQQLQIPLIVEQAKLSSDSEQQARQARRFFFKKHLQPGEVLLTAHHLQDQAETVVFRLLRGSGINGLAGIRQQTNIGDNTIFRPFIQCSKKLLTDYLTEHDLDWVEDPSNQDLRFSRNHIRHQIIPRLQSHRVDALRQIAQTADNCAASERLLQELLPKKNPLNYNDLAIKLSAALLYHWLLERGQQPLPRQRLSAWVKDIKQAAKQSTPELYHHSYRLLHWRDKVYLLQPKSNPPDELTVSFEQCIVFPKNLGGLYFSTKLPYSQLIIRFSQTGEKILLSGQKHQKKIKKLYQQVQTPPWEKAVMPFLYHNQQLLAVGDYWLSADFYEQLKQHNCQYRWQKPAQLL